MIVNGYKHSYKLPITIVRSNNIFGSRQYPEKLIPGCCLALIKKRKFYLHGSGNQKRTFLHVKDFCKAIEVIIKNKKTINKIYNIGSTEELSNKNVVRLICKELNINFKKYILHKKDRPFNDFRYSVNFSKIKKLKWYPKNNLKSEIKEIINWYKINQKYFR